MPCLRATVKMRREWSEVRSAGMEGMGREGNGVRWSEVEREEREIGERKRKRRGERKRREDVAVREPLGNTCGESRKKELVRVEINPTRK